MKIKVLNYCFYFLFMKENYLFIYQSPPPKWKIVVAALLFSVAFYNLYRCIQDIINPNTYPSILSVFFFICFIIIAMPIATTTNFHLDIENDRFKEEKQLGRMKIGWWEPMFPFDYVSVFKFKESMYVIRLWFDRNEYFTVAGYSNKSIALEEGEIIARKMSIDLLDAATDPRNSKWIDLSNVTHSNPN